MRKDKFLDLVRSWSETKLIVVILLVASFTTHFMWLGYPAQVIFDEVHFGKFITAYCCTHANFFDIHPPHAKLLIAGTAYLLGYRGGMTYEHIGQPYGAVATFPLRVFPAITGLILPLLIFILLRQLHAKPAAAFLGAALVILDNALTIQTRIIALDGLLLASITGSLVAYLAAKKYERLAWLQLKTDYKSYQSSWRRLYGYLNFKPTGWLFLLAGGLAGLAVGTKFTGLVAVGLLAVLLMTWLIQIKTSLELKRAITASLLVAAGALFIYFAGWAVHFILLTQPGSGDVWHQPQWHQPIMKSLVQETLTLQRIMYQANSSLRAEHHDGSYWWSWPLVRTPVFYWQHSSPAGPTPKTGTIYFMANPLLWWGLAAALIITFLYLLISALIWVLSLRQKDWRPSRLILKVKSSWHNSFIALAWLPLLGYAASYIPLMTVPRVLFLYHYLTPLLFNLLIVILWLDYTGFIKEGSLKRQSKAFWLIFAIVALSFLYFTPLTYGFMLPDYIHRQLFWFPSWR